MYVGITSRSIETRFAEHVEEATRGNRLRALTAALRKYGPENFSVTEVQSADSWESLCDHEKGLIEFLGTKAPGGYNLTDGGDGTGGLSQETRDLIAAKTRGRKHSKEARDKIGAASRGRVLSDDTRKKLSIAHTGKTLTAEHRAKLSAAKTGRKQKPRTAEHSAKIAEGQRKAWARRKGLL